MDKRDKLQSLRERASWSEDGWAPCEQDEYNKYEDYETDEYLDWLHSADYDEVPTFEESGWY